MKEKLKDIKRKLKLSSLVAITSANILASSYDDTDEILNANEQTPHVAYVDKNKQNKKLSFSYIAKTILMIPLWIIGSILLKLLEPLKSFFLSFIFTFIVLTLIVLLIAKLLFPNLKLKDILSLRNLLIIGIFSLLINISKYVLMIIDKDLLKYTVLMYLLLGFICLIIVLFPLIKIAKQINLAYKTI